MLTLNILDRGLIQTRKFHADFMWAINLPQSKKQEINHVISSEGSTSKFVL